MFTSSTRIFLSEEFGSRIQGGLGTLNLIAEYFSFGRSAIENDEKISRIQGGPGTRTLIAETFRLKNASNVYRELIQ